MLNIKDKSNKTFYSISAFFRDIKREISSIKGTKINYRILSTKYFMRKNKWAINDIILHSKGDPNYVLIANVLNSYERAIKSVLYKEYHRFKPFFEKYRRINLKGISRNVLHQNLIKDYFKKIDSKEKAYWLLWLLAEGHLNKDSLRVRISVEDGILIRNLVRTIGLDPRKVRYARNFNSKTQKLSRIFEIRFYEREFRDHLIDLGFPIGKKSEEIRFPDFSHPQFAATEIKHQLEKAGLLGFFDGDGSHKTHSPLLYSTSLEFIKDIIRIFALPSYMKPRPVYNKQNKIVGYRLYFGSKLFMKLLNNYDNSLPRKRVTYSKFQGKFMFTKEQLQKIVVEHPKMTQKNIADLHFKLTGIKTSRSTVGRKMNDWNIKRISNDE